MKLSHILKNIQQVSTLGPLEKEIDNLSQDTREEFTENTAYFAVQGTQVDGHKFIDRAIEKGALVIFCEILPKEINPKISYVQINSMKNEMGEIVSCFYGNPSQDIKIIAITGTNGKTTVATIIYQSLIELGQRAALFSTAGDFLNGKEIVTQRKASSSMEVIEFHKQLQIAKESGCEYLCMEATSHALDQGRLSGVDIDIGIYTNLSQDHLDYHKTFDCYLGAKKKLFDSLDMNRFAIINADDSHAQEIIDDTKASIIYYGASKRKNILEKIKFEIDEISLNKTTLSINNKILQTNFIGDFNMYNLSAAFCTLEVLGFDQSESIKALQRIKGVRGRLELVAGKNGEKIGVVDYAHTPDALQNVFETLKKIPNKGIITVVGAGGDRDRTKRPLMGKISQENSDYVFFTSDNPRTENQNDIFNDLEQGCNKQHQNYEMINDRELAIKKAVTKAVDQSIILVAGKGHENYQIIGNKKEYFDDMEVLKRYLHK